ncbi:hypothetical protein MASR2M12_16650 [Bacteroidales bacterium]
MNVTIIGAGNGGQAMAGHFTLLGHSVKLYNRTISRVAALLPDKKIRLTDQLDATITLDMVTDNLRLAIQGSDLIMVTTTADAHKPLAKEMAPYITDGQTILLNPGRTLGAIEFSNILRKNTSASVYIGEAQSLIYACRAESAGNVRVIGIKDRVLLAAYPSNDTDYVLKIANSAFHCFEKASNVLRTSLENIGAIFHPTVIIFNAAAIERGNMFYFYNDMTSAVADFLTKVDQERLNIGQAFGIELLSVFDWISYAYNGVEGNTLMEKMRNNPAYYQILAPKTLHSRLLLEDVPTGILPLSELAKIANVSTPLLNSIVEITQALLGVDFRKTGRTLENLGLNGITIDEFKASL